MVGRGEEFRRFLSLIYNNIHELFVGFKGIGDQVGLLLEFGKFGRVRAMLGCFLLYFGKGVFLLSSLKSFLGTGREETPREEGSDRRQV